MRYRLIDQRIAKSGSLVARAMLLEVNGQEVPYVSMPMDVNEEVKRWGFWGRLFRRKPEFRLDVLYPVLTEGAAIEDYFYDEEILIGGVSWPD